MKYGPRKQGNFVLDYEVTVGYLDIILKNRHLDGSVNTGSKYLFSACYTLDFFYPTMESVIIACKKSDPFSRHKQHTMALSKTLFPRGDTYNRFLIFRTLEQRLR